MIVADDRPACMLRRALWILSVGLFGTVSPEVANGVAKEAQHHTVAGALPATAAEREDRSELFALQALCSEGFAAEAWGAHTTKLLPTVAAVRNMFDLADLAELLRGAYSSLQVVGGTAATGRTASVSPQPVRRKGHLMDYFRNATLTLARIETKLPRLAAWSRAFASHFGVSSEINLFLTPPGAQALSLHNNRQDVFVVQVLGDKAWKVWDLPGLNVPAEFGIEPVLHPFRHTVSVQPDRPIPLAALPTPSLETGLKRGSTLYIPRGSLQVASTAGTGRASSSLHLSFNALTQSFSYAIAVFHLAAEDDVKSIMLAVGWDLHRFRQSLMRIVDEKTEGVPFRQSLPLGWAPLVSSEGEATCLRAAGRRPDGQSTRVLTESRDVLETLLNRVFLEAPKQPPPRVTLSDAALRNVAAVFAEKVAKFHQDLAPVSLLPRAENIGTLELPPSLTVAFVAWGLDEYGAGEIEARFSWCGRSTEGMARVLWPAGVLPMLDVVSSSPTRLLDIAELSPGTDPVPKLIFALELTQLALDPPIRIRPRVDKAVSRADARLPDCGRGEL